MPLFRPRTILLPTWQGWILLLALFLSVFAAFLFNIHGFLAVTERVPGADILVLEAWTPKMVVQAAAREFSNKGYRFLLTNDVRSSESVEPLSRTDATRVLLESFGVPADRIVVCPVPETDARRSHAMALSVKAALRQKGIKPRGINVIAPAAHARKSWQAYRQTLSPDFRVGIVAVPTGDYDPARWWRSSQGAKWVIANGVGWFYELVSGIFR